MSIRGIFPIGIGTDICQISRIYRNLSSATGPRFIHRILTQKELQEPRTSTLLQCILKYDEKQQHQHEHQHEKRHADSSPYTPKDPAILKAAEFMAGRFAAKEAVMKAFGFRKIFFGDVDITYEHRLPSPGNHGEEIKEEGGEESITGSSHPDEKEGDDSNKGSPPIAVVKGDGMHRDAYARLSISHDGDYAVAMCLAYFNDAKA